MIPNESKIEEINQLLSKLYELNYGRKPAKSNLVDLSKIVEDLDACEIPTALIEVFWLAINKDYSTKVYCPYLDINAQYFFGEVYEFFGWQYTSTGEEAQMFIPNLGFKIVISNEAYSEKLGGCSLYELENT